MSIMHVANYKYSPLCILGLHIKLSCSVFSNLAGSRFNLFSEIIIYRHPVGMYIVVFVLFHSISGNDLCNV